MAGKKGRSGGSRPNTGGARAGSGRKPKEPSLFAFSSNDGDPKTFLTALMNDQAVDVRLRVDAAKSLMPFCHPKLGEGGKKEQKQEAAKRVSGRFAPGSPPKLVAADGKKI